MQGFSLFFQDQAGQRGSFGPIGKITHQNGETFQWKCPQKTQHRLFFVRADDCPAVQDGAHDAAGRTPDLTAVKFVQDFLAARLVHPQPHSPL